MMVVQTLPKISIGSVCRPDTFSRATSAWQ